MATERHPVSLRLERLVLRSYPDRFGEVLDLLQTVYPPLDDPGTRERVCAAMLAYADGDVDRLLDGAVLAEEDWRDLLMAVPGFAHEGWELHVNRLLGPVDSGRSLH